MMIQVWTYVDTFNSESEEYLETNFESITSVHEIKNFVIRHFHSNILSQISQLKGSNHEQL